jgi:PAS domain S-box-containing protein
MKLQTKLFIFALPLYFLVVILMTALSQYVVREIVEKGEYKRGLSLGRSILKNPEIISGFRTGSENLLLSRLHELQEHAQAQYAMALDQTGHVLSHTNVVETGKVYTDSVTVYFLSIKDPVYKLLTIEGQPIMDLAIPIQAARAETSEEFLLLGETVQNDQTQLGILRIGLPLNGVLLTAQNISDQVFWIITVGSTVTLILGLVFIRRLLQPIQQLSAVTERVGRGHLGETVMVSSKDEIGDLARQFNRMSRGLAETTVSVETLRESEERFRRLSDSAFEGIFIHQGLEVIDANDVFARILGYKKADDIIGLNGWKFVGRKNRRTVLEFIRKGDERPFEITINNKDGVEIHVELIGRSVPYDGQVIGVVAIRDIRNRIAAEETRRQLERQLVQSERMASVGTVAAGIVHNLKNPLTGIMGFAQLLKLRQPDSDEADRIVNSAQQMNEMIENILSKSRQKKTPEPVDINQLLQRELDFLQADRFFKQEVALDIHLEPSLPKITGVYTDLSQVFGNLLRNAAEAMYDQEEKKMTVSTATLKGEGVLVEIGDTGYGIPEENLSELFVPFFTTKEGDGETEPKGTGLGLYMVQQILNSYGAKIDIESTVGKGTTFQVMIPIK